MRPPELEELIGKIESQRDQLVGHLRQMTEQEAGRRASETQWSAKEQVAHLTTYERLWLGWTLAVRDEPGCQVGPTKANPEAYPEGQASSLDELLRELASARTDTIAAIEGLTAEELQRKGKHNLFGEMSVLQMLRSLYRHDRMHMDQMAERQPSYNPPEPRDYAPPAGS